MEVSEQKSQLDLELEALEEKCLKMPGLENNIDVNVIAAYLKSPHAQAAINILLKKGKLDMSQDAATKTTYCKLKNIGISFEGLEPEEALVYEIIAKGGNQGLWNRDIRSKSGLLAPTVNKVMKILEGKKKIKSVKSVLAGKKKVYMLYELTPDAKVTGDLFYSDQQEFDTEFTDVMFNTTISVLEGKAKEATSSDPLKQLEQSYATVQEVLDKILQSGLFKVTIAKHDMTKVLNSLTYSGRVESSKKRDENGTEVDCYRLVTPLMDKLSLVGMPCGACPVMHLCSDTGSVTPNNCIYLHEWLNLELPANNAGMPGS